MNTFVSKAIKELHEQIYFILCDWPSTLLYGTEEGFGALHTSYTSQVGFADQITFFLVFAKKHFF